MGEGRDIINLDSAAQNLDDEELCLLLQHELGHSIGLDDDDRCYTIMGPAVNDGSCRSSAMARAIQAQDVESVRQHFANYRGCTGTLSDSVVSRSNCADNDSDGVTTCDGDCDDFDYSNTYDCYYFDPQPTYPPQEPPRQCYREYRCYDYYVCTEYGGQTDCSYDSTECYQETYYCN